MQEQQEKEYLLQVKEYLRLKISDPIAYANVDPSLKQNLITVLTNSLNWRNRGQAASVLGELACEEGIQPLIETLATDVSAAVRAAAAVALAQYHNKSFVFIYKEAMGVSLLTALDKDYDEQVRAYAAYALGELGEKSAFECLKQALSDKSSLVRSYAAYGLGGLKKSEAVKPLLKLLKIEEDIEVRWSIVTTLGKLRKTEKILAALISALSDDSSRVRAAAVVALGQLGDKSSYQYLLPMLNDSDYSVRNSVPAALKQLTV